MPILEKLRFKALFFCIDPYGSLKKTVFRYTQYPETAKRTEPE